jgi:hypothetical protein
MREFRTAMALRGEIVGDWSLPTAAQTIASD